MKTLAWKWKSMPDPKTITRSTQAMEEVIVANRAILASGDGVGVPEIFGTEAQFDFGILEFDAVEFNGFGPRMRDPFTWPGWLPGEYNTDDAADTPDGSNQVVVDDQPYGKVALLCLEIGKQFFGDQLEVTVDDLQYAVPCQR